LADFGLSKRIDNASNSGSNLFGVVPYIDPKAFSSYRKYSLNQRSDVYSVGVLLWEISSGQLPFYNEKFGVGLAIKISQGQREKIVPNTPVDYSNLYTGKCNLLNFNLRY
jgi:serine/threonine protein kinase